MKNSEAAVGGGQMHKPDWILHLVIGVIGLGLLVAFAVVRQSTEKVLWTEAEDVFLRDMGVALVVAVVVAWLFDKAYHHNLITTPFESLRGSVTTATNELIRETHEAQQKVSLAAENIAKELADRDKALKAQYNEMMASFSLLARSNALGVMALLERGEDFKRAARSAVDRAEKHCWIVGRTHKEMLGAQDEGKGWLVDTLENTLQRLESKAEKDAMEFSLRILLANPFDQMLEPAQTGSATAPIVPRLRNPAREPVRGVQESRKAIYRLLAVLSRYSLSKKLRIEFKLLRTFAVPYCMLMTEERMFVEHYLPSREGGALSITEIEPREAPREQAPFDCFKSDFRRLFERGEECDVVLQRFRERKIDQYSDESRAQCVDRDYPELQRAIADALRLSKAQPPAPNEPSRLKPAEFRSNCVMSDQQSIYAEIIRYIKGHEKIRGGRAIVVQYSAVKVEDVLIELMEKGVSIDLYVQKSAISKDDMQMQTNRIQTQRSHLPAVLLRHNKSGTCRIYEYSPRATMRGIWIENHLLAIGPYIYQNTSIIREDEYRSDGIVLKGHDAPGMLLWDGTREYEVFHAAFIELVENFRGGREPDETIPRSSGTELKAIVGE